MDTIAASGVRFQKKEPVSNVRSDHWDAFDGRDAAENLSKTSFILRSSFMST